ncbi:2-hydroxyacid dehydrogenase [Antarcticimicrobium sediminis]|uniref:Glyoxylate/hydroxypyruvate reductase A n=1 Tax=Antarcticimicrobium sediminis TaxID=2546227 RepID=A0A4R5EXE7_9RHOB|nr:glyoxylate/hydroxypyruvate reductase A [Antarcticimicrobium sediminis]TDE39582.1 glyoxylate/hydroxypyruvate reductase A [Antarcticimicrobium sediminis]
MTTNVLFLSTPKRWAQYQAPLMRALAATGLDFQLSEDLPPEEVEYIVFAPAGRGVDHDFTRFPRLKAVLSLWAGIETVVDNPTLTVPLARMVDHGLTQGMVEWVTGHVLRHHLGMDAHILGQNGTWNQIAPPLARERRVTILGLGTLGSACGQALASLGFPVTGWSRSAKSVEGITCLHGADGMHQALACADILVLLLPNTPATRDVLNAETLAQLPQGAVVLNPGRGPLVDDEALLAALDSGHLAHATLDTFRVEPLPPEHPFWAHPKVTVTPHIASETRADTAADVIAENIRRGEAGEPLLHLVDRSLGY